MTTFTETIHPARTEAGEEPREGHEEVARGHEGRTTHQDAAASGPARQWPAAGLKRAKASSPAALI